MVHINAYELDTLWDTFHRLVNMTSQELGAWLRTSSAHEGTEELPEDSGTRLGRQVLAILKKRRVDLTEEDVRVMYKVVDAVTAAQETMPAAGPADSGWRHHLMTLGHDPLRPA